MYPNNECGEGERGVPNILYLIPVVYPLIKKKEKGTTMCVVR